MQLVAMPLALSGSMGVAAEPTVFATLFRARTAPRVGRVDLSTLFGCLLI